MSITIECPDCEQSLKFKDKYAGKKVRCPECEGVVRIPELEDDEESEDEPPKRRRTTASRKKLGVGKSKTRKSSGAPARKSAVRKGADRKSSGAAPSRKRRGGSGTRGRRGRSRGGRQEQGWSWQYSYWTGIWYGPIPVGFILVFVISFLAAIAKAVK